MKSYDVIIIGGGASGLYLAAALGGRLRTAVLERGPRVGRKLSATGGGQGNLSNTGVCADRYFGDRDLISSVLGDDRERVLGMFDGLFVTDKRGRIYPAGRQASALTDCLRRKASAVADVYTDTQVTGIERGFTVTAAGETFSAERVAICTGGRAAKQFGTDGSAYDLISSLGHTITPTKPSIVGLRTDAALIKTLKGVRVDCIARALDGTRVYAEAEGEVIFGDGGTVGGSAIYYLSPFVTGRHDSTLELEFLPGISEETIADDIRKKEALGMPRSEWLTLTLNNMLGRAVMARTLYGGAEIAARNVKHFKLPITGCGWFDTAQVTKGGVPASEVTYGLESRLIKGLYFAGEVLDVDGECGGFNLHWAFASALRVAGSILAEVGR